MINNIWKKKIQNIPSTPGVYLMRDAGSKIIYIGKAKNLKRRVISYFQSNASHKAAAIANTVSHIDYLLASSERASLILERQLINDYQPYFNAMWKDDKSYPYLKLTLNEDFPRLIFTRKLLKDGSEYFGPYPKVYYMKRLLRWMHRLFKWRTCRISFNEQQLPPENKVKSCLYLHTERCPGPCVGKINSADYKKIIKELSFFLKSNYDKLNKIWNTEMLQASKAMDYEKAAEIRDRIKALEFMHEKVTVSEIKPDDLVYSIKITQILEELKSKLNLDKWPITIEGFDISNISGTESVGSMVSFQNARPDKDNYRKYKIKTVSGINDFLMIREIVFRRYSKLKMENKKMPDLILIDGGKGQLSSAKSALDSLKLNISIISLAKKEEEIFMPNSNEPLKMDINSPALHLLQQIRDESHRFALSFHHFRRKKILGITPFRTRD